MIAVSLLTTRAICRLYHKWHPHPPPLITMEGGGYYLDSNPAVRRPAPAGVVGRERLTLCSLLSFYFVKCYFALLVSVSNQPGFFLSFFFFLAGICQTVGYYLLIELRLYFDKGALLSGLNCPIRAHVASICQNVNKYYFVIICYYWFCMILIMMIHNWWLWFDWLQVN